MHTLSQVSRAGRIAGLGALLLVAPAASPAATGTQAKAATISTVAFGSCAHQGRIQNFWSPILASKPDLFIFAGDNIYADTYDSALKWKKYQQLGALNGYKRLKKQCPILATWDDHDYGLNDSGAEFPMKQESQRLFLDFFGVPTNSPRRAREGVYDARVFGPPGRRVQVILLDTRYFRSPLKLIAARKPGGGRYRGNRDKGATILGEAQWAWLEKELKKKADLRLLVSSIQVLAQNHDWECWMNFPAERARLFGLIKTNAVEGLVVLSGDRHFAELSKMPRGPGDYPLYDLTSSGLNMSYDAMRYEPNRWRVGDFYKPANFGVLTIDWEQPDPPIRLEIRDLEGNAVIGDSFTLGQLRRKPGP